MTTSTGKRKAHFKNTKPTDPTVIPFNQWTPENRCFYADLCLWLKQGGYSASACNIYSVAVRFALGYLNLPSDQIQLENIEQVRDCLKTRALSPSTLAGYSKGLSKLVEYLGISKQPDVNWKGYLKGIPPSLATFIREYVKHCSRSWWNDNSVQLTRNLLSRLSTFCHSTQVNCVQDISPKTWFAYAEARLKVGTKPNTVNASLRTLQSFLRYLESEGTLICKRMLEVRPLKTGQPLPRDLFISQVKLLLKAVQDCEMDRAWILLMLHSGLRTCEVRNLRVNDLDLPRQTAHIRETKNQQERMVYISPPAVKALQGYLLKRETSNDYIFTRHHKQLSKRYYQSRLKTIGKKVNIKVNPHQLRHMCGTLLLNAGMSIFAVQSLLGHRYVETTLNYARLYDETIAKQLLEVTTLSH